MDKENDGSRKIEDYGEGTMSDELVQDQAEKMKTFEDVKREAWEVSHETLGKWKEILEEHLEGHAATITGYLKSLSVLYGVPAPKSVRVCLNYYPGTGSLKGEPIRNFGKGGTINRESVGDIILWVSDPQILPTDSHETMDSSYFDTAERAISTIEHEVQHNNFQNSEYEELLQKAMRHPEIGDSIERVKKYTTYQDPTNELITAYLECLGTRSSSKKRPHENDSDTRIPIIVGLDERKAGMVLEMLIREDVEGWKARGINHGPYSNLRYGWAQILGSLPEGYNLTPEEIRDIEVRENQPKGKGQKKTDVYEIGRSLNPDLAERYLREGKRIDVGFLVELFNMVDEELDRIEGVEDSSRVEELPKDSRE